MGYHCSKYSGIVKSSTWLSNMEEIGLLLLVFAPVMEGSSLTIAPSAAHTFRGKGIGCGCPAMVEVPSRWLLSLHRSYTVEPPSPDGHAYAAENIQVRGVRHTQDTLYCRYSWETSVLALH